MRWVLQLVETGTDSRTRSVEVLEISRPNDLGDIANLGLTLPEAKQLLARVQDTPNATETILGKLREEREQVETLRASATRAAWVSAGCMAVTAAGLAGWLFNALSVVAR